MAATKNPVLREDTFSSQAGPFVGDPTTPSPFGAAEQPDRMTIRGVINKGAVLLLLMAATFIYAFDAATSSMSATSSSSITGLMLLGGIGGFITSLVISFKPRTAPFLAPVFALLEGLLLGAISAFYEYQAAFSYNIPSGYDGIVFQAMLCTAGVFAAVLMVYRTGLVKVTSRMRKIVTIAMLGIVFTYLASFLLSFAGTTIPMIHEGGPIGIGFSVVVLCVASFMLLVDFDMIEQGAAVGAPKYMEWYGAFALLVSIVWIYLEMLRLLSKLRR